MKGGVSLGRAQSEMDTIAKRLAERYPQTNAKLGIRVVPLREKVVQSFRPTLLVLLGSVRTPLWTPPPLANAPIHTSNEVFLVIPPP